MLGTSLVLCTQTEIVMRTSTKNNVACPHTHTHTQVHVELQRLSTTHLEA